jgi:DNA-binding response OmpR family regulator/DNA-binding CsgD family transcriptional regulator
MQTFDEADHVLVVDDDPDAVEILCKGLTASGMQIVTARSGEQALACLAEDRVQAVLLDVLMPGMDGFETCRRMREMDQNIPIIFMTGLGESEHVVRGFQVGGTDYVTKPVIIPVVMARLQAHTRTSRLMRTTREALSATDSAMLACDVTGRLMWSNNATRRLVEGLDGTLVLTEGEPLPEPFLKSGLPIDEETKAICMGKHGLQMRRVTNNPERVAVYLLTQMNAATVGDWKPPRLTDRESEVLLWVARGKTNRDIGEILGLSPRTVNKHLEHIFEKLGVETRTAAAAAATHRLGLAGSQ